MVLLRFARCARASAGESLNRTTFPFTTAVACITQANRKQEADKPSRFPSQANMMLPTARMNIARHADQSRHSCATAEIARGGSLVTFEVYNSELDATIVIAMNSDKKVNGEQGVNVLLRYISKILVPDNPVNVPVIK
jgi:hypothetical protein